MNINNVNIWLMGGLGNQLFQLNKACELRQTGLQVHLVKNLVSENSLVPKKVLGWKIHQDVLHHVYELDFPMLYRKNYAPALLAKNKRFDRYACYYGMEYDVPVSKNMFGYFQRKISFNLMENSFISQKCNRETVMHLRLTDNNQLASAKRYYVDAINNRKVSHVKVVTDDNVGAEKFLKENTRVEFEIISSTVVSDFNLLRTASTLIAAPSTFSFWAAITNKHATSIIVPELFNFYVKKTPESWELLS